MEMLEKTGRTCGNCGGTGHNTRTCGKETVVKAPTKRKQREESGPRTCGACGETGHNARTCGKPPKETLPKTEKPEGQGRVCGICHNPGHNARTCPATPLEKAQAAAKTEKPTKTLSVKPASKDSYEAPKPFVMQPAKALDSIKGTEDFCPNTEDGKHIMKKDKTGDRCEACSRYNPSQASIDAYKANVAASKNKNKNDS